jgi:hypothetical protein
MFGREFVTDRAEGDLFSQVLFAFIESRAAKTSKDEAFAIVHSEPAGERDRRTALFASAEALAEFERLWGDARGRRGSGQALVAA